MQSDFAIIGGGVVGLAVAWGLLLRGRSVTVLDGDDGSFRASRGNFGLVWVQGKGLSAPGYARWSQRAARLWPELARDLQAATGIDPALRQDGGYDIHLDEAALEARARSYAALGEALGGDYPFEVLGHNALRREEPAIGARVAGAILHHDDGHVNPLRLLRALAEAVVRAGGHLLSGRRVVRVAPGFEIVCADGETHGAGKVVLSAGLGAAALAPALGLAAPVRPERGQILITEKLPRMLNRPSGLVRQVDEGAVQIGNSKEDVGFDDATTLGTAAAIAARAVAMFPPLARAQVVRGWGALRVLSPDGLPIYQESATMPGAYLVTCHSGVTLAAAHARLLPPWLDGAAPAPDPEIFGARRFH